MLLAMLLPASAAVAAPHSPTGEFAPFADCPLSNANAALCLQAETKSGYITIGNKKTPIVKPVILQGGLAFNEAGELVFLGAEDGETLTKAPQPVPGGLLGITAPSWWPSLLRNLFNETINNGFTGVTATMELAGPSSSVHPDLLALLEERSTPALSMPVKVKLSNPFLGNSCYLGSNSNPIKLNLTTGTTSPPPPNSPISGDVTALTENPQGTLVTLDGVRLVDNSFAVPGANGCGGLFSFLVDPFVNEIVGTPAAAGKNTAVLEGTNKLAPREAVIASEP
ncbi:MAG TPA: hypothetical protein VFJ76_06140 [Solirubrobacterales bacterium]|nr:hypothetical protein [Solirubrobacterales bacterium]